MDTQKHSFNVESYKQIRAEVAILLGRIETLFRYSLVVIASVFSWLVSQSFGLTDLGETCLKLPVAALFPAWLIPPAFVVLSGVITLATYIRILQMGEYLKVCELHLGHVWLSWELFIKPKWPLFTVTTGAAWALMLGAAAFGAWQGWCILADYHPPCTGAAK